MKLNKTIRLKPTPYKDDQGNIFVPKIIETDNIDVSYIVRKESNMAYAQINGIPGVLVLTTSDLNIGTMTINDLEQSLRTRLTDDPEKILQNLFPKSLDSDPNGPGSVLSNMLSSIGIKSSPTCSCKQRAIEMNEQGNDWCEQNIDTIVEWLREESQKRRLPFIETVARLLIKRSISLSRKLKSKHEKNRI
jgi:hypothetical protein